MPNVTFFFAAPCMPADRDLAELDGACTALCVDVLGAALENVHIINLAVHPGRGLPAFAEVQFRLEPFRPPAVMEAFMAGLDEAILRITGLTARIRCFGHAAGAIHARH